MKHSEKITPVAAVLSTLSTLACCLPSSIAAAAGSAGLGVVVEPLRPWLLALSIALLVLGFVQLYRTNRICQRRSLVSIAVFVMSAILVLGALVFPQITAGLLSSVLS
jgi:cytochrome bd-type quinol oxidase subunit 2